MRIRNPNDVLSGLMFVALGVAAIAYGSAYDVGTSAQMGPGYFPRLLGAILVLLGAGVFLQAFIVEGPGLAAWQIRPLLMIVAVVVFALVVETAGLLLAVPVLVILSSLASREFKPTEALLSSLSLAIFAAAVFAYGLGVQLPLLPSMN